jgi:hypothetical protein
LIKTFLNSFDNEADKQFASHLIAKMLKNLKSDDLIEYDMVLSYVRKAVVSSKHVYSSVSSETENLALRELERLN